MGKSKFWWQGDRDKIPKDMLDILDDITNFYDEVYYISDGYYSPCIPDIVNMYAIKSLRVKELESIVFRESNNA